MDQAAVRTIWLCELMKLDGPINMSEASMQVAAESWH